MKKLSIRRSGDQPTLKESSANVRTFGKIKKMERVINLHIQRLPEGLYLATSDSIQGLVAQGRTISETIEIARDIAKKLIEAQEDSFVNTLVPLSDNFDYPMIIGV
jgi:predicted RNase H-like HicB family nuclease